jgi:hypothetical protein
MKHILSTSQWPSQYRPYLFSDSGIGCVIPAARMISSIFYDRHGRFLNDGTFFVDVDRYIVFLEDVLGNRPYE